MLKKMTAVGPRIFVDGHTHLWNLFDPARFLAAALKNFSRAGARLGPAGADRAVLFLMDAAAGDAFGGLAAAGALGGWRLDRGAEPCSLVARLDGREIVLVAGRQYATGERLEILALGGRDRSLDGLPALEVLERIRAAGELAVLPWAFGKWWGRRGGIARQLCDRLAAAGGFLGDNAGRPALLPRPCLFSQGEALGLAVLPGSDPLPLPGAEKKAACFGFVLPGGFDDPDRPWEGLARRLQALKASPAVFGAPAGIFSFVHSQAALWLQKKRGGRS